MNENNNEIDKILEQIQLDSYNLNQEYLETLEETQVQEIDLNIIETTIQNIEKTNIIIILLLSIFVITNFIKLKGSD